jgi:hypothetical protein
MVGAARLITVLAGLIATFIAPAASSAESMSATGRPEREYQCAARRYSNERDGPSRARIPARSAKVLQ